MAMLPYPVVDSLTENMTISHLYSLDIRNTIDKLGIQKICDPMYLFRQLFTRPDKFNDIFKYNDVKLCGYGVMEYFYYGRMDRSKEFGNYIRIYADEDAYSRICTYLEEYEKARTSSSRNGTMRIYYLSSGMMIEVYMKQHYYIGFQGAFQVTPVVSNEGIDTQYIICTLYKNWTDKALHSIEFGIPTTGIFGSSHPLNTITGSTISMYDPLKRQDYMAYCILVGGPLERTSSSEFVYVNLKILPDGSTKYMYYPVSGALDSIKYQRKILLEHLKTLHQQG